MTTINGLHITPNVYRWAVCSIEYTIYSMKVEINIEKEKKSGGKEW
jgi:hypothetical protein